MEMVQIIDFITNMAEETICEIRKHGYVPGGHNGPYYDNETPVRNSAHWIVIFSWLYRVTREERYKEQIYILTEYLYQQRTEPGVYAFHCRNKEKKDHVNGTIGQAWAIEGLVEAAKVLNDEKYYELAKTVFAQHEFSDRLGIWNRVETDGRTLGYDNTYNHQLWLAAAGAEILSYKDDKKIREQILCFLDKSTRTRLFSVSNCGRICHFAYIPENWKEQVRYFKRSFANWKNIKSGKANMTYKEEGYHWFNLYGFALIHQVMPEHPLFRTSKFRRALQFALDERNLKMLENRKTVEDVTGLAKKYPASCNIYSYGYNSPAMELPFICREFGHVNHISIQKLWEKQVELTCKENEERFGRNTEDPQTLTARLYELVRAL